MAFCFSRLIPESSVKVIKALLLIFLNALLAVFSSVTEVH